VAARLRAARVRRVDPLQSPQCGDISIGLGPEAFSLPFPILLREFREALTF